MNFKKVAFFVLLLILTFSFNVSANEPEGSIEIKNGSGSVEIDYIGMDGIVGGLLKHFVLIENSDNVKSKEITLKFTNFGNPENFNVFHISDTTLVNLEDVSITFNNMIDSTYYSSGSSLFSIENSNVSIGKGKTYSTKANYTAWINAQGVSVVTIGDGNSFVSEGTFFGQLSAGKNYNGGIRVDSTELNIGDSNSFEISIAGPAEGTEKIEAYGIYAYNNSVVTMGNNNIISLERENESKGQLAGIYVDDNSKLTIGDGIDGHTKINISASTGHNVGIVAVDSDIVANNELSINVGGIGISSLFSFDEGLIFNNVVNVATSDSGVNPNVGIVNSSSTMVFKDSLNIDTSGDGIQVFGLYLFDEKYRAKIIFDKDVNITSVKNAIIIGYNFIELNGNYTTGNYSDLIFNEKYLTTIRTTGDEAHAINFLTPYYLEFDNTITLNNSDILLTGDHSDVLHVVLIDMRETTNAVALSFENMKAKTKDSGNLITAGGTFEKLSVEFKDSRLEGDVLAASLYGRLDRRQVRVVNPDDIENNTPYYKTYNSNVDLILSGTSTWLGSKRSSVNYTYDIPHMHINAFAHQGKQTEVWVWENAEGYVSLYLEDQSGWLIGKDSRVDLLNMEGKSTFVEFLHEAGSNEYYTAHVTDRLEGEGSMIMNVDMTLGNAKGDFFDALFASGEFEVTIKHNDKGGADKLHLIRVAKTEIDESYNFTLTKKNRVQIGSYIYTLERDAVMINDWYLKLLGEDVVIKEELKDSIFGLFEFAKAVNATLSDDLLLGKNKIWLISFYKLQNFQHSDLSSDLKQQMGGGIVGLNQKINDNFSIGEFAGLNIGYQDIGKRGSVGHIANLTAGMYARYNKGGFSISAYVRASDYIHDLVLVKYDDDTMRETLNTYGFSASVQTSYRINLLKSDFFVEPKGKATFTYVAEQTYDVGGMRIFNLSEKALVTWLGARIGVEDSAIRPVGYYAEIGWMHDTNPSISYIKVGDTLDDSVSVTLGKNRFEVGVGITSSPLKASLVNLEFKYAKGKGITEPIKLKLSASTSF